MAHRLTIIPGDGVGPERTEATCRILCPADLGELTAAASLEPAIAGVIREDENVIHDLKPSRDDPTAVVTCEAADAIIEKLGAIA